MREAVPLLIQFAVICAIGSVVFLGLNPHPNPKVPLLGGLLAGCFGGYAAMFLYTRVRYGWRAARSVSLDP